jgi:diguanylate cyclase (GGDEF)-like protein/PAS domain S-box-containing protein
MPSIVTAGDQVATTNGDGPRLVVSATLQESFGRLLESAPDAMVIVNADGEIVLVNGQTEKLFGYARDELLGERVELLVPGRFRDGHAAQRSGYSEDPHTRAMGAGLDLQGRRKDGTEFPVEISLSPLETDEGRFVTSAIRDITQRKRSEDRFRRLLESAPDAIVIVNAAGEIVLINAQTEKLFGYSRNELLGERVELLVPDRFRDRHSTHRTDYSEDPHTRAMGAGLDLMARRKDGTEFPVEISLSPIETEDETLVSSAIRDITDRKRAEQDASHFRAVVESSHDAIISKDLEGRITSWNAGAERLYGYPAAEILDKSISVLVPPGHDDEVPEILRRVRLGERVDDLETVRARKDGTHVEVSMTVSPIRNPAGNVIGIATIARDIGVRRRYQEQLRFLAEHDALTGARNRRGFERDVSEQVGRARRYGEQAALLIIDVNDFKQINDVHGHKTGDRALKEIAAALRRRLRATDVIGRIGGDEFAVLLPYAGAGQAEAVREDLRRVVNEARVEVSDGSPIRLSASIGMTLIDSDTASDEAILAEADRAMYRDKTAYARPEARR